MAKDEPEALSDELWRRRDPRPAAPYFKRATEAAEHAFDRERGSEVPASWLMSHGRSLVRYHLHPESKFRGGDYDQRGALRRRHVVAFAMQAIGKESDDIEENEFIGEDAGPTEHPMALQHLRESRRLCRGNPADFGNERPGTARSREGVDAFLKTSPRRYSRRRRPSASVGERR